MKKIVILIVSMVVLSVSLQAQTTFDNNLKNFTISAAEDTVTGADTVNATIEYASSVDYGHTYIVKTVKTAGTLTGAGISMWGRNKSTDSWTQLTASNYYTAMQASDTLTTSTTQQFVYVCHHSRFRYVKFENKVTTGTVATTVRDYLFTLPSTSIE